VNVLDARHDPGVEHLLFLGPSCMYPKLAPPPITEGALLTDPLEPTNACAIAKIIGILNVQTVRRQDGLSWTSAMPANLYGHGRGGSFDLADVRLPLAIIRRFPRGRYGGGPHYTVGSGSPRREVLHVDDPGAAGLHLIDYYDDMRQTSVDTVNTLQ
jgi:GDP-L-fucose synthase